MLVVAVVQDTLHMVQEVLVVLAAEVLAQPTEEGQEAQTLAVEVEVVGSFLAEMVVLVVQE